MMRRNILLVCLCTSMSAELCGCQWGERRGEVKENEVLPGLSVCEVDDVFLTIRLQTKDSAGFYLFVNNLQMEEARLRVGEQFVLSNGNDYAEWYRVILLQDDRIVLKRTEVHGPEANRKGLRTTETVIAVKPYNLEPPR